jgi:hypothetical protein
MLALETSETVPQPGFALQAMLSCYCCWSLLLCCCWATVPEQHMAQQLENCYIACLQGVEFNSEGALHAVSQGRGRATGCANLTAAETIAAQRCLRNSACSKALGHAGFCDNGKPAAVLRHNPLAGLAAAAEQASNGSAGDCGQTHHMAKGTFTVVLS